jgi:PKD repeat protein
MQGVARRPLRVLRDGPLASPRTTGALLACLLFLTLALLASASADASTGPGHTGYAKAIDACPRPGPGEATCFALVREAVTPPSGGASAAAAAGVRPFVAGSGAAAAGPAGGLTPEDLAGAYDYTPSVGGNGQTVGIVDAFDDPNLESDLASFDGHYGLPACTSADGCLRKVGQTGGAPPNADKTGWSAEIALDVETVHAVCPNCRILLVEAASNSFANLATAANEAVALGATEVSNSYGAGEEGFEPTQRAAYEHPGIPIVASTGDDGYYSWDFINQSTKERQVPGEEMPNVPASLPSVIAVGGTSLTLEADGTRAMETVWDDDGPADQFGSEFPEEGATGGGCSHQYAAQPWQREVSGFSTSGCGSARLDADVSAVADPFTGFDVYDSYECGRDCNFPRVQGGWITFGGTSLSAPLITALYALAGGDSAHLPYPSLTLYGAAADASSSYDVTEGANGYCGGETVAQCGHANAFGKGLIDCEGTTACNAAPGYDGPTGVGTPEGLGLFEPESPSAAISAPGALTAGSSASFSVGFSDPYPGGSIGSASWSWGDGTTSGGASASHVYAAPGPYTVTLAAIDRYGIEAPVATTTVNVAPAPRGVEGGGGGGGTTPVGGGTGATPGGGGGSAGTGTSVSSGTGTSTTTGGSGSQGIAGFNAGATPHVPSARLASVSLKASAGKAKLQIACASSGATCSGTVALTSSAAHSGGARQRPETLGSASFTIAAGKTETVTVRLSAKARAQLAKGRGLKALASLLLRQAGGAARPTSTAVTIRPALASHRSH